MFTYRRFRMVQQSVFRIFKHNRNFHTLWQRTISKPLNTNLLINHKPTKRFYADELDEEFDENELLLRTSGEYNTEQFERSKYYFGKTNDPIICELNESASVEEALKIFNHYKDIMKCRELTQLILVLRDLQKMFIYINDIDMSNEEKIKEFYNKLIETEDFQDFLKILEKQIDEFNTIYLIEIFYNLNKLGMDIEDGLMQKLAVKLADDINKNFSLKQCSKVLKTIFTEHSIRPYFICKDLIPKVFDEISKCDSVEKLDYLTDSLNSLHSLVTSDTINEYDEVVDKFIKQNLLECNSYKTVLKVILLLNYPSWRTSKVKTISRCLKLIEPKICELNVEELVILFEIFFKNQEPGDILNEIQRAASKCMEKLENYNMHTSLENRLKLFSSLIYFSSPTHRQQFQTSVPKYLEECNSLSTLLILKQIISYVKVSDSDLCREFWAKVLKELEGNEDYLTQVIHSYMNFNVDVESRYLELESAISKLIAKTVKKGFITSFPSQVVQLLNFYIVFGKDRHLLEFLISYIEENETQIKHFDCLKLAKSLNMLRSFDQSIITSDQIQRVEKVLNKATCRILEKTSNQLAIYTLLKCSINRNENSTFIEDLFLKFKEDECFSSKIVESICFSFVSTGALIPEVLNKVTGYIVENQNNILGFNAEKALFMCYYLGYIPLQEEFFSTVANIIIRDQERLSGLSVIQSALSLCFFHQLPPSFTQYIFNTTFLDKLDIELANCYSREIYPQRVRSSLMQLNRGVCLEYPERNIPWFHRKYQIEMERKARTTGEFEKHFPLTVKEYMKRAFGAKFFFEENVITPYGHHIDFVICLNKASKIVPSFSEDVFTRLAVLLQRPHAYTKFFIQLKGKYQLKKRHLEILGYQVVLINFSEWINLLYSDERLEYLVNKILYNTNKDKKR